LEREIYEQYLIRKAGGIDELINVRNPIGGRRAGYANEIGARSKIRTPG
jgi:hypothetical protein